MRYKVFIFSVICLMFAAGVSASEFRRVTDEGSVALKGIAGKMIEVRCAAGIASLVRSGDITTLKVERVADRLFMTPLSQDPAELVVLDMLGRSYRLYFLMGSEAEAGVVLGTKEKRSGRVAGEGAWTTDLLRAMVSGKTPAGATEEMAEQIVFKDERMRVSLRKRYVMPPVIGYVFEVANISPQALLVPVERLSFPGMLAIACEEDVLEAAGKTKDRARMFMIAGK